MKILVTPQSLSLHREFLSLLEPHMDLVFGSCLSKEGQVAASECDVVILGNDHFDEEIIRSYPKLQQVVRFGTGIDNVDVKALEERRIDFQTCESCAGDPIAMYVLTSALYYGRMMAAFANREDDPFKGKFIPKEPAEMNVGIIGMGNTGTATAFLLKRAGFQVLGYSRRKINRDCREEGITQKALEPLLAQSDIISLHLSLNDDTRGFLNENRLQQVKSGATIINPARGEVVDERAIIDQLDRGNIAYYVSDFPFLNPEYAKHPKVFVTPHIAGRSLLSTQKRAGMAVTKIVDFFNLPLSNQDEEQTIDLGGPTHDC